MYSTIEDRVRMVNALSNVISHEKDYLVTLVERVEAGTYSLTIELALLALSIVAIDCQRLANVSVLLIVLSGMTLILGRRRINCLRRVSTCWEHEARCYQLMIECDAYCPNSFWLIVSDVDLYGQWYSPASARALLVKDSLLGKMQRRLLYQVVKYSPTD